MNITFFIGNGFDINLGLKSKYNQFYPYYLGKQHDDIIAKAIRENHTCWADLEMALAEILKTVKPDQIEKFLDSKAQLETDLAEYLHKEEQRIDVSCPMLATELKEKLTNFYKEFGIPHSSLYISWVNNLDEPICYHFVSFNYTHTLDCIVECAKATTPTLSHNSRSTHYKDIIESVVHIHGSLSDGLVLGIDNTNQIYNVELCDNRKITDYLIKPTIIEALRATQTIEIKRIIKNSQYICIYGMSLGDSDISWWKYLLNWLYAKNTRKLVLYIRTAQGNDTSAAEKLRQINNWKERFLKKANAKHDVAQQIKKQIIVVLNSNIFDFENISTKTTTKDSVQV